MKKLLAIIVLGLLFSGNASAEEIILQCNITGYKDKNGWDHSSGNYGFVVILDTDKKEYKESNTKKGNEKPLITGENFFGTYQVFDDVYGSTNPTITITYSEINRFDGKQYYVNTSVPVSIGKNLQKLAKGRDKEKAYYAIKDLALEYSRKNIEETVIQTYLCTKSKKAF